MPNPASILANFRQYLTQKGIAHTTDLRAGSLDILQDTWLHDDVFPELPARMTVHGSVCIYPLSVIPERLVVLNDLQLDGTNITTVPLSLSVGGNLLLVSSAISSLPDGFRVGGNLELMHSRIMALPQGLDVGGHLNVGDTGIQHFPQNLRVGGIIFPPSDLPDIQNFMAPHPDRVELSVHGSRHERMHAYAQMLPFPQLLRVLTSIPLDHKLVLERHGAGRYICSCVPA